MADNLELNSTPEPIEQQPVQREYTEVEQRAMEQGWVPQDEWQGEADGWRPAKEFLDRGELFKRIDEQKRELKHLKQAMEAFGQHHARVREVEYRRALNDLKAQKAAAIENGDAAAVVQIDDAIDEVKEQAKTAAKAPMVSAPAEPHPAYVAWEQRNTWYKNEKAMKIYADEVARDMVTAGERDVTKILSEVDRQVRKEFPTKFTNPNREKAGAVEGSTKQGSKPKDHFELSDDERRIMNRIVSTGVMTKEQYIAELKATKG